jgi:hypothetical protein
MLSKIVIASSAVAALTLAITGCSSGAGSVHPTSAQTASAATSSSAAADTAASTDTAVSTSTTPSTIATTTSAAAPNAAVANVDVCSLMTAAQATALNKVTYGASTAASPASYYKTCTYKNMGSTDPIDIQALTVSVISFPGCWSELQKADGPGKPVSGVGKAAFGTEIGMDIEAGARCVEISGLTHAEFLGNYRPDVAMAKIILAKLH